MKEAAPQVDHFRQSTKIVRDVVIPHAAAAEPVRIPATTISKPASSPTKAPTSPSSLQYWAIKEAFCAPDCEYKNKILKTLQQKLLHREPSMPMEHVKQFSMQAYQENGSFDIWSTHGDSGRAVGLGQWNVSNAKNWLAKNCAKNAEGKCDYEKELERQLYQLADEMVGAYRLYKGNIKLAIVDHNRPKSAQQGSDQCLAGPTDYDDAGNDCYYKDQVMRHKNSFELR